ncbi:MAG: LCP family protein [Bacillota bacterium]|nr:LCP family protein [Bacillota bacterium]
MGYNRDTKQFSSRPGRQEGKSSEQIAREQAYQEYLRLREDSKSRGNYVKNDDLYGSYFPGSGTSVEDTPYGRSDMRRRSQKNRSEQIARQGRINKADKDKRSEVRDSRAEYEAIRAEAAKENKKREKMNRRKKKSGRGLKVAVITVLVLVLGVTGVLAAGITIVKNTLDNVGRVELDPALIGIDPIVDQQLSNYRNIAILGIDARDMESDEAVRSDAIIIASINKETGEIKLFSVYRDTMLDLGDDVGLDKITHAYYYGGPTKALYTINKNLDLNVKEVMVVNWKAVADVVDALGGIDVEIQDSEINEMNKYIKDTQRNIGGSKEQITEAGKQTLNGVQAVTYSRIRKDAATGDYRRNERMKIVVKATFEKALQMDVKALKKISNEILPQIKTNMSSRDMMGMIMDITTYEMTDSIGWPYETRGWTGAAWYGPPVTLNSNVVKLHEELFNQEDYVPTQAVQDISAEISAKTGYY